MKRQHSIGSSSSVESSCSHPTDSRRENVPKYNETSQLTNDGWEIWSTNRKRDSYKKSKLPADDGKCASSYLISMASYYYVEANQICIRCFSDYSYSNYVTI